MEDDKGIQMLTQNQAKVGNDQLRKTYFHFLVLRYKYLICITLLEFSLNYY